MVWRNLYGTDWVWDGSTDLSLGNSNLNNPNWIPENSVLTSAGTYRILNGTYGTLTNNQQTLLAGDAIKATGTGTEQAMSLLMNNTLATSGINYDAVAASQAAYRATGYAGLQRYSTMPIIMPTDSTGSNNSFLMPLVLGGLAFFFLK